MRVVDGELEIEIEGVKEADGEFDTEDNADAVLVGVFDNEGDELGDGFELSVVEEVAEADGVAFNDSEGVGVRVGVCDGLSD